MLTPPKQPINSSKVTETWSKELTRPFEKPPIMFVRIPWYRKFY
jgi:hypothetical protein